MVIVGVFSKFELNVVVDILVGNVCLVDLVISVYSYVEVGLVDGNFNVIVIYFVNVVSCDYLM